MLLSFSVWHHSEALLRAGPARAKELQDCSFLLPMHPSSHRRPEVPGSSGDWPSERLTCPTSVGRLEQKSAHACRGSSQAWTGAKSQAGEKDDLLARCLVSLQSDCNTVTLQVEALQKENRAMKELELEVLRSNTPREVETVIPRSGAHCVSGVLAGVTKSLDEAEPEAPLVIQPRKSKGKKRGKTKSFGIPDSPSVSLSAARLGMVTQRQELMEELETEQVHLRTMLSEFVPSGERRNVHRTRNCLQKISRRGGLSRRRARSRRRRQLTDVEGEGGWAEVNVGPR
eukprot:g19377.t2